MRLDFLSAPIRANFDTADFEFEVLFNPEHGGCETHLRSRLEQKITFGKLNLTVSFQAGESVRTGTQRKFRLDHMKERLMRLGFRENKTYTDAQGWYAAMLLEAV